VERCSAPLACRVEDPNHPQAVRRALGQKQAATEERRQFPRAERLRRKRRKHPDDVVHPPELDTVEHVHQPSLAGISCPTPRPVRPAPHVILAKQQHLDREVGMGQERGEGHEPVEHVDHTAPPG
jgi:hypothetical protein